MRLEPRFSGELIFFAKNFDLLLWQTANQPSSKHSLYGHQNSLPTRSFSSVNSAISSPDHTEKDFRRRTCHRGLSSCHMDDLADDFSQFLRIGAQQKGVSLDEAVQLFNALM